VGFTIVLTIAYDGRAFSGFQIQPDVETVQGRLEDALETVLGREAGVTCAGRTDAGVHALGQVVSLPASGDEPEAGALRRSLDALTGPDVSVRSVAYAAEGFSARHSAVTREYRYRIADSPVAPLFLRDLAWWVKRGLDADEMARAARALVGTHDFATFCTAEAAREHPTTREITSIDLRRGEELGEVFLEVRIVGRSFLHSMVRIIVGSLVEVGSGKRSAEWLGEALPACDRTAAGPTAPPHGLTLWRVTYPEGSVFSERPS
jgi:tRNA pseudouridine38-40 synthase